MIEWFALLLIVFILSGVAVSVRRGMNEVIRGLESIDQRLATLHLAAERRRGDRSGEG